MAIIVDSTVKSISFQGSNIKSVSIGGTQAWNSIPHPPKTPPTNPHFIINGDQFSSLYGQHATAFRRTNTPLGSDAIDISAAKDRSILAKGEQWYSAYPVVYLNAASNNLFMHYSPSNMSVIDFTGISTYFVQTMMKMFQNAGSPNIIYGDDFWHNSLTNLEPGAMFVNSTFWMFDHCGSNHPNWPDLKYDSENSMFYK